MTKQRPTPDATGALFQQGDVLIERIDAIPMNCTLIEPTDGRHVLARGEATGHAHTIEDDVEVYDGPGPFGRYCRADAPFTIVHEEHKPITIPAGTYEVRGVREYDHTLDIEMGLTD